MDRHIAHGNGLAKAPQRELSGQHLSALELRYRRKVEAHVGVNPVRIVPLQYKTLGMSAGGLLTGSLALLADADGPFGNPSSDSVRTSIGPGTTNALIVVFGPADTPEDRLDWVGETITAEVGGTFETRICKSGSDPDLQVQRFE